MTLEKAANFSVETQNPTVKPGGLVTVAFLKAKLDENKDRLSIFMPLVLDAAAFLAERTFTTSEVQEALAQLHNITIPHPPLETLLRRCKSEGYLKRDYGRWEKTQRLHKLQNVSNEKANIENAQNAFARRFVSFAIQHNFPCTERQALDLVSCFLDDQQIAVLLDEPPENTTGCKLDQHETALVAEFMSTSVRNDPALSNVLKGMLEGLVLYHAAFIPDFEAKGRNFNDLIVYFDSDLVRRALGYEGRARQTIMREIIKLFHASGIRCYVFDKTVVELQHILEMYESQGSRKGRRQRVRYQTEMDRYFLSSHFSRGDISEMIGLLQHNIEAERLRVVSTPTRLAKYVSNEAALQRRLANPFTQDESAPRIAHDVDCIAAILTLRKGRTFSRIEDSQFIFASSSFSVIRDICDWYTQDDQSEGVPPIIHLQVLSNLAWLKNPMASSDLKEQELMALCASAIHPSEKLWKRFIRHLAKQRDNHKITSDEQAAILVDHLSQQLLFAVESYAPDGDVDADSIDDVIDRVKESYKQDFGQKLAAKELDLQRESHRAEAAEQESREFLNTVRTTTESKARRLASALGRLTFAILAVAIAAGTLYLLLDEHIPVNFIDRLLVLLILLLFALFDFQERLERVRGWCSFIEERLFERLKRFFNPLL